MNILRPYISTTVSASDLSEDFRYRWTHNLGTRDVIITMYDENGVLAIAPGIAEIVDDNSIDFQFPNDDFTGTYTLGICSETDPQTAPLFNQEIADPTTLDPNYRIAVGQPNAACKNITINQLAESIEATIAGDYLQTENCLSEIAALGQQAQATARNNLNVYSSGEIDAGFIRRNNYGQSNATIDQINATLATGYSPAFGAQELATAASVNTRTDARTLTSHFMNDQGAELVTNVWKTKTLFTQYDSVYVEIYPLIKYGNTLISHSANTTYTPAYVAKTDEETFYNNFPAGKRFFLNGGDDSSPSMQPPCVMWLEKDTSNERINFCMRWPVSSSTSMYGNLTTAAFDIKQTVLIK